MIQQCKVCSASFDAGRAWNRLLCDACRAANLSTRTETCSGCGAQFPHRRRGKDANKYCSKQCPGRSKYAPDNKWTHWWFRTCPHCKELSISIGKKPSKYCSSACRFQASYVPITAPGYSAKCVECGNEFHVEERQGKGSGIQRSYCSLRCYRKVSRRDRKALVRGSRRLGEVIRFTEVYDRDNGKCHICGLACARQSPVPHPLHPTIDHVVPLSRGGVHSLDNVKIAHFVCNTMKSDRHSVTADLRSAARMVVESAIADAPAAWRLARSLWADKSGFRGVSPEQHMGESCKLLSA